MKRTVFVGLVSAAFAFASGVPVASAAQVFNGDIPIVNEVVVNPCNDESVTENGVIHELLNAVDVNSEDIVVEGANSKNLTGLGSLGNSYHVAVIEIGVLEAQAINEQATFTEVASFKLISDGSAPNFRLTEVFHLTFANGELISDVEIISTACVG